MDKRILFISLVSLLISAQSYAANCPSSCCGKYLDGTDTVDVVINSPVSVNGVISKTVPGVCDGLANCGATSQSILEGSATVAKCPNGCVVVSGVPQCKSSSSSTFLGCSACCKDKLVCSLMECNTCDSDAKDAGKKGCWFHPDWNTNECYDCKDSPACGDYDNKDACELNNCEVTGGCSWVNDKCEKRTGPAPSTFDCDGCCKYPCSESDCIDCSRQATQNSLPGCYWKDDPVFNNCLPCDKKTCKEQYKGKNECIKDSCNLKCTWDDSKGECVDNTGGTPSFFDCDGCCGTALCTEPECDTCDYEAAQKGRVGCWYRTDLLANDCINCNDPPKCSDYTKEPACAKDNCGAGGCVWNKDAKKCEEEDQGVDASGILWEIKTAVKDIVCTVYCILIYIVGGICALVIIISGMGYMSSEDASSRAEARKRIIYALVGAMVIFTACPLINLLFEDTVIGQVAKPCSCNCLGGTSGNGGGSTTTTTQAGGGGAITTCYSTPQCEAANPNTYCKTDNKCYTKNQNGEKCDTYEVDSIPALSCKSRSCQSNQCEACYSNSACPTGYECQAGTCTKT